MKLRFLLIAIFLVLFHTLASAQAPPFSFPTASPMGTARYAHTSTELPNGQVLMAGGLTNSGATSSAELFDPSSGTFSATTGGMGAIRYLHTATLLNNGLVLITGGYTGSVGQSTAELYNPATGTFSSTGSMNAARYDHTATLLPNGDVLITGGFSGVAGLNSAEVYNPTLGTFTPVGNLNVARYFHTATLLATGKVLITGGISSGSAQSSAEIYDPATQSFALTGSMSSARQSHTATLLNDGRVLVVGGGGVGTVVAVSEIYDPGSGAFFNTGSLITARYFHTAALLNDGRVLVTGGKDVNGAYLNNAEVFDPAAGTFLQTINTMSAARYGGRETLLLDGRVLVSGGFSANGVVESTADVFTPFTNTGSLGTASTDPRSDHTATLLDDGRVLVAGGFNNVASSLNTAKLYGPSAGTFSDTTSTMASARYDHTATLLNDGRVLLTGGYDSSGVAASSAEIYDPALGSFTLTLNSMTTARAFHSATLLNDGRVLIAGGYNVANTVLNSAEIYNPATGTFTATGSMNTARGYQTATLMNDGRVLIAGGYDASNPLASAEIYDPALGTFTPAASMNSPRGNHTATLLNNGRILMAGGYSAIGVTTSSAELYDPLANTFTATIGNMSVVRAYHTATLLQNGHVLIAGGYAGYFASPLGGADDYDPAADGFSGTGTMADARAVHTATLLNDGRVLLVGGNGFAAGGNNCVTLCTSLAALASAELFNPGILTPAHLSYITVTPANPTIQAGMAQAYVATGTFADSHTETLQSVTWNSSNVAAASITNDAGNHGHAYALSAGSTAITACAGAVCGYAYLNVIPRLDHFDVSASTSAPIPGVAFSVIVSARDASNAVLTGYQGTIHFSLANPDGGATLPADYTFVTADNGTRGFVVTLTVPGAQTLNVSDTVQTSATGSSSLSVTVVPITVAVSPASVTLPAGAAQTFVAIVSGTANGAVTWSVNGIVGGNATVGTITSAGIYTAPVTGGTATITATSLADVTKSASAAVSVTTSSLQAVAWGYDGYGQLGDGTTTTISTPVAVNSLSAVTALAGGTYHSLARQSDGTVWAWGYNGYGQLGNGTNADSHTPVQVSGLSGVIAVAAGYYYSLALKTDGTVWAWGYGGDGELGNGTFSSSNTPVQVSSLSGVIAIAAGSFHALALKNDGTVWAWGYNGYGQLGDGTLNSSSTPIQVSAFSGAVAVTAGYYHSLALKSDGSVWGWGYDGYGQLGQGTALGHSLSPVQANGLSGVVAIAAGGSYNSLALKSDGTVWAWGYGGNGQLGNGAYSSSATPVQVSLSGAVSIAGGGYHGLALKSDGTVWAWGYNGYGQLGNSTFVSSGTPVQVGYLSGATSIAAGDSHSFAATPSPLVVTVPFAVAVSPSIATVPAGTVRRFVAVVTGAGNTAVTWTAAFGSIDTNGFYTAPASPGTDTITATSVADITQSASATVTITASQLTAAAWGYNAYGQLGEGTTAYSSSAPVQVSNLSGLVSVAAGYLYSLALKGDGTVWAWGYGGNGELGNGTLSESAAPVQVSGLSGAIAITGGAYHAMALKSDGSVWAWGYNSNGQLGNGTNTNSNTPVQVSNLSGMVAVSAGWYHSLALKNDGTVWAWGYNGYGQLGNGTYSDSSTPVQVSNLSGVVAIAAGYYHSLALKSDGTVWGWGYNSEGELGNGTITYSATPVQVIHLSSSVAIASGYLVSLAVTSDGSVWAWGYNYYGQLGNGTTNAYSTVPVQTSGLSGVSLTAEGFYHTLALKGDGTVWAWGYNGYGQLGNGTYNDSSTPVQVSNLSGASTIATGGYHSLAVTSAPLAVGPLSHFAVTPATSTPNTGVPFSVTVTAQDSVNNTITAYTGTVHFSLASSDAGATLPADYTFVAGDNGSHTFALTLIATGSQTIMVNDTQQTGVTGSSSVTVLGGVAVTVSPSSLTMLAGSTQQFTATVTNATNTAVTWSVNGIVGGDAIVGTISASGLYTAPASFAAVTVTATSVADPTQSASASVLVIVVSSPALVADYQFAAVYTSSVGEPPALTDIGTGINTFATDTVRSVAQTVLVFPTGNGLQLAPTTGLFANSTYTISVLFRFDINSGYRRILDFENATSDDGLYNYSGLLNFYPVADGTSTSIPAGTYVHVVLTRAADSTVIGYVNGVQQFSFTDSSGLAVISSDNVLRFFKDDNQVGGENSSGAVARIRIWNGALSAADVAALDPPSADLVVSTAPVSGSATSLAVTVTNIGPSPASNVVLTDTLDRFDFVSAIPSQGNLCTFSAPVVSCPLGTIAAGSNAVVTVAVTAPSQGWASQTFHATSDLPDPNPANNSVRVGPSLDSFNTSTGNNVGVEVVDGASGADVQVVFGSVQRVGATTVSGALASAAWPAGFRPGNPSMTYDVSTSALYSGPVGLVFRYQPSWFHKPAQVRLFHMENGAWVDRTTGVDVTTGKIAGQTASLSPFVLLEPVNHAPVAAASDQSFSGSLATGAQVRLDGRASSDADGDALTYRWTGPFAEGGGTVTGAQPTVTLPFGVSKVALVVNDGEADSAAATVNITVSDFRLGAAGSSASVNRGQSATYTISVAPMWGSFDGAVALSCSGLPAGSTCSFSPASVTPAVNGAASTLTITTSTTSAAAPRGGMRLLAFWLAGPFGFVLVGALRKKRWLLLGLMVVLLAGLFACGGGGAQTPATSGASPTTPSTTVSITVTGTSGAVQHSTTVDLTLH